MTNKLPSTVRTSADADAILRARAGITLATAIRRIERTLLRARPADLSAGVDWYWAAQEIAREISLSSGISEARAAVVIAHLSPRTPWARNVSAAHAVAAGEVQVRGCLPRNVAAAVAALAASTDEAAMATLRGPKVRAFAANICGDTEAVTVDVWAARVALQPDWKRGEDSGAVELIIGRTGVYAAVAHAYRLAARRQGLAPSFAQAVAWIVVRNGRAA